MVEACPTCQHHSQEPRQLLQHQHQNICGNTQVLTLHLMDLNTQSSLQQDTFHQKISLSQYNAAKTISKCKKLFSKHEIPETIRTDTGPQDPFLALLPYKGMLIDSLMPIFIQLLSALPESNMNHCLKGSGTRIPKLQLILPISSTMPPGVPHTMTATASRSPHFFAGQTHRKQDPLVPSHCDS